jgi:hypothetical protein
MAGQQFVLQPASVRVLAALADALIPGGYGMPSFRKADPQGRWLRRALRARPDLHAHLAQIVEADNGSDSGEAVERLPEKDEHAFRALGVIAAGAYLMTPTVRQIIGYPGQTRRPILVNDWRADLGDLLEPVLARGPIYRRVGE